MTGFRILCPEYGMLPRSCRPAEDWKNIRLVYDLPFFERVAEGGGSSSKDVAQAEAGDGIGDDESIIMSSGQCSGAPSRLGIQHGPSPRGSVSARHNARYGAYPTGI